MVVVQPLQGDAPNSDVVLPPERERRTSARIQKLKTEEALRAPKRKPQQEDKPTQESAKKKSTAYQRKKPVPPPNVGSESDGKQIEAKQVSITEVGECAVTDNDKLLSYTQADDEGQGAYARVVETLRTFNKRYLQSIQEEEKRCRDQKKEKGSDSKKSVKDKDALEDNCKRSSKRPDLKAISKKSVKDKDALEDNCKKSSKRADLKAISKKSVKDKDALEDSCKRSSKRPDLKAISKMMESKERLYTKKRIGSIPGIDVGHQFFSRCEMVAVGFHSHWLNGIDFIGASANKEYSGYTLPLAVCVVLSGQYEDDEDKCDRIIYTGQGGNDLLGNKRQISNQVMERGNLGLKNCMEQCVPVRVVRGHQSDSSYVKRVYTYDGLYQVVKYWAEVGYSGYTVYKFQLRRLEGQPTLTTSQVEFIRGRIPNSVSEIRGLVCEDISGGQENFPIPATNSVDDPPVVPTGLIYRKCIQVAENISLPRNAPGCNCKGECVDPRICACAKLNGSDFPYVNRDGGRLIEPKAVVFECGPNCGCGPGCVNRTSQRGLKYRLEVFRTPSKGWGVRCWDHIPSGAPVCEYIGVIKKTDDVDSCPENNYIFDIDCLQTMKGLDGREKRIGDVSVPSVLEINDEKECAPEFCIDAGSTGNVARFINHSCQPNLFVQCVLSDHHDVRLARVVLFAADNIPPLKELSYDYGYTLDSVMGPDGKAKELACFCGAPECRKRLF